MAAPTANWPTNGGNWYNQRYSPLTKIDRSNVANLKGVWRTRLRGSGIGTKYSGEAQPIVYDGVVYVVTGADDVFALGVESGEILWSYAANLDASNDVVCCGWTSRGVGFGDGKVFVGQLDGKLVALDQKTGKVEWSVQAERWQDGLTITSAPLYYDGLVITGFAGAEYGIRGRVKAFDARSGKLVWTFYTIPGPGEFGHDTWPQDNDLWMHGGASVWQTPAVDPELGLIFFSTGNPGPDYNGGVRAGDNLFSASIVALDAKTGEYRWHFQQVHHDIWDYDGPSPVVLFDLELNGAPRKGLAQPSKTGWVYILDRTERHAADRHRRAAGAAGAAPSDGGDAAVPARRRVRAAVDRRRARRLRARQRRQDLHAVLDRRARCRSSRRSAAARTGRRARTIRRAAISMSARRIASASFKADPLSEERPPAGERYVAGIFGASGLPNFGVFAALDMHTNTLVWQQQWADACYSGSTTTAGGLTFVGRNDGRLTALDSRNGAKLWEFQTGAGMNAPVSVFEHARQAIRRRLLGRQFVRGLAEGRQRLAVRLGRHVAARAAARRRDAVHARGRRHGRSRRRQDRLRDGVRVLSRRARRRRPRRRQGAERRRQRRRHRPNGQRGPQRHAAVRRSADA